MLKEIDINALIKSTGYFREFRRKNLEIFKKIYYRLEILISYSSYRQKYTKEFNFYPKKIISTISIFFRQLILIPKYVSQIIDLRDSKCKEIESCSAFSIASSRLDFDADDDIYVQLNQLTKVIGSQNSLNIFSSNNDKQKTIILYDPQIESGFWHNIKATNKEKIYIFDGCFIVFLSLWLVASGILLRGAKELIFIKKYIKLSRRDENKEFVRFHVRIVEALAFISFNSLIQKLPKHKTIFLTSNSFFIELLRAFILQNGNSGKIIELLHGIIADPTEKWFFRILNLQEKFDFKRHTLVPQIPNLPELLTINSEYFEENNISINTYLNSFLYQNKKQHGTFNNLASHYLDKLGLRNKEKKLILTIYGGTSIEGEFFNSSAFEVEVEILKKTINYFASKERDIKIIYVPHPANKILPKNVKETFKNFDVQLLNNSIFTYLITDYCISNISSCLFELNWLGAKSFSPLIEADGFYSKNYLKTIYHPKTDGIKALEDSLYECFDDGIREYRKTVDEKFSSRIKKIKGC